MRNAVLLHGRPAKWEYDLLELFHLKMSNTNWFSWLRKQLVKNDFRVQTPEIPHSYKPEWQTWVKEVENCRINEDSTLVGHSTGAGFWVRYLSEHPELKVGKVVLVAPWIDVEQTNPEHFFDFKIDPNLAARTKGLVIFSSDNDMKEIQSSVKVLVKEIKGARVKNFHGYGHFTIFSMKTKKFPELLKELL